MSLFLKSVLGRPNTLSKRGATDYLDITLRKAAARQIAKGMFWIPKVRSSSTNSREGRPPSGITVAVLALHADEPELKLVDLAARLGIDAARARTILMRQRRKATLPALLSVVERSCDTLPEPVIAKEEPTKEELEELMSCPRRYRMKYGKPAGWIEIPYMPILADGKTYESTTCCRPAASRRSGPSTSGGRCRSICGE